MTAFGIGSNPLPSANSHYRLVSRANGVSSITVDLGTEKTRKSIEGTQVMDIQVDEKTGLARVMNGSRTSRWMTTTFQQDGKRAPKSQTDVRTEIDTFQREISDR